MKQTLTRVPPHDLQAEESLLGAMLLSRDAIAAAIEICAAGDFFKPSHGHVFDAIRSLHGQGEPADPVTVADELRRSGLLDSVGGPGELVSLMAGTPSTSSASSYARIIEEHARLRRLIVAAGDIADLAYDLPDDVDAAIDKAEASMARIRSTGGAVRVRAVDGATFALDLPPDVEPRWGKGDEVLWAQGESLLLCGPTGVGKTTVAQQIVLAAIGLRSDVLGFPVARAERVLYVAADRPSQVRRSLGRMVNEHDRDALGERLTIWRGPLPVDIASDPTAILRVARDHSADVVVLDSLKDIAADLSKDETGSRVNIARQEALAGGVDLIELHHQRKGQQGAGKPRSIDDVYGSTWLTAGAGSVVLLWAEPGDSIVELLHLKQPCDMVGPLKVKHDHQAGVSIVVDVVDLLNIVRTSNGLTVAGAALALFQSDKANQQERARAQLKKLETKGLIHRVSGQRGGAGGGTVGDRYYSIDKVRETG